MEPVKPRYCLERIRGKRHEGLSAKCPYKPRFTRDMRWQDTGRGGTLYYPIWLAYATGVLEQAGCEVRLVDTAASKWNMEQVLADIVGFHPDLVVIDTSFQSKLRYFGSRDNQEKVSLCYDGDGRRSSLPICRKDAF